MTAAPDSALLPALVAAEKATAAFGNLNNDKPLLKSLLIALQEAMHSGREPDTLDAWHWFVSRCLDCRAAHALIQAAIKQHNGEKV